MQILNTNKLFYGKWPYKVVCAVKGAWSYRYPRSSKSVSVANAWRPNSEILTFIEDFDILEIERQHIKLRVENNHFNIFCQDEIILNIIKKKLKKWIVSVYEPATDAEKQYLIDNGNKKILCNTLPLDRYQYKIYLNPHIESYNKLKFWEWLSQYGNDRIRISHDSKHWLLNHIGWIPAPFLYVTDRKDLSMICLYLGSNLKKVEEFVLRDDINTKIG